MGNGGWVIGNWLWVIGGRREVEALGKFEFLDLVLGKRKAEGKPKKRGMMEILRSEMWVS
jgi:hypothetical protein